MPTTCPPLQDPDVDDEQLTVLLENVTGKKSNIGFAVVRQALLLSSQTIANEAAV